MHKERNLLAHAPRHLHEEIKADFNDMVHARTRAEVLAKRKAFLAKWRLRCRPVAESLEEAGERLFTFLRYPPEQWRSVRTTDEIDKGFSARPCYSSPARATAWRTARQRLEASPACLITMSLPRLWRPCASWRAWVAIARRTARRHARPGRPGSGVISPARTSSG